MTMQPVLVEIDMRQTTKQGGAGIEVGPTYLALYEGRMICGTFSKVWFGLNFFGSHVSLQYDPPGENYSGWQRLWRIENAGQIAAEDEMTFAKRRRDYAIAHGLHHNGQRIDHTAPLEAFLYRPTVPAMPPVVDEDGGDDDA